MPKQTDDYQPTEEDIDLVVEEITGKPVKPANLAAGIAFDATAYRAALEQKIKLLDRMDEHSDATLKEHLATVYKDLAKVRE